MKRLRVSTKTFGMLLKTTKENVLNMKEFSHYMGCFETGNLLQYNACFHTETIAIYLDPEEEPEE